MNLIINDIGLVWLVILILASFCTSMVHGATGVAGGLLMTILAAPILGFQTLIPVLSITLLISHSARALFNIAQFDKRAYLRIAIPAVPFIVVTAFAYGRLSNVTIALILGTIILLSIPLQRWAKSSKVQTSNPMLFMAGCVYGGISGVSIGPGMLLMPVLLGLGMNRQAFVATLAAIALTTNIVRSSVYGIAGLLDARALILGLLLGLATIPGAWVGRSVLRRMTDAKHIILLEWLLVLGALNMFWMAYRQLN